MGRSFDHLARPYRALETLCFGDTLETARFWHVEGLAQARRVLILGEGDGRFLERLLATNRHCEVVVVDKSAAMVKLARERSGRFRGRVSFRQGDATQSTFDPPYDAIVTLFFLDCFEDPELGRLLAALTTSAAPNALWAYSDFCIGGAGLSGVRQRLWLWSLYRAFGAVTDIRARRLEDPLPALQRRGWQLIHHAHFSGNLVRACRLQRTTPTQA